MREGQCGCDGESGSLQEISACRHSIQEPKARRMPQKEDYAVRAVDYLEWFAMTAVPIGHIRAHGFGMRMERIAFSHCHVSALASTHCLMEVLRMLPVIDLSLFDLGNPWRDHVASQIDWAAGEHGLFHVVGHGIEPGIADSLLELSSAFTGRRPSRHPADRSIDAPYASLLWRRACRRSLPRRWRATRA